MYKVFINQLPLILASTEETINTNSPFVDILCENSLHTKKIIKQHLDTKGNPLLIVRHSNIETLWNFFFSQYKPVMAAGGLVVNKEGKILFIYRNNKWDLPKGKIDAGEEVETAALREVNEECGLVNHKIKNHLVDTYHTYPIGHQIAIKTTTWFLMETEDEKNILPQLEEGITKVEWRDANDWKELSKNSYGSIQEVMNAYLYKG